MAKWAYTANGKPKALPQFPPISRPKEKTLHHNNKEKATIFAKYFFPLPVEADFNNILSFIYPKPQTTKTEIEKENIITVLKGLAFDKAPGPKKKFTNQFLKICGE